MAFFKELARAEKRGPNATERFLLAARASERAAAEPAFCVTVCNELGGFYRANARYEESCRFYSDGLAYAESVYGADSLAYGTILMNRAGASRMAGDTARAIGDFEAALRIVSVQEDCNEVLASTWNNLGLAYYAAGRREDAVHAMKKSLSVAEITGDSCMIGTGHLNLASVCMELGRREEALEHAERGAHCFAAEPDSPNAKYAEQLLAALRNQVFP